MASKREQVLSALFTALSGISGPVVMRGEVTPQEVPSGGILILRDGDPGEPEVLLSPPTWVYEHTAEIEVVVDSATAADRDALFDDLLVGIGSAIAADRTLGGLADWVEPQAPAPSDLDVEGAPGLKAAMVPVMLHYASSDPLG